MNLLQQKPMLRLTGLLITLVLWSLLSGMGCTQVNGNSQTGTPKTPRQSESDKKMLALLADVARKINGNPANGYAGEAKLAQCNAQLSKSKDAGEQLNLVFKKAAILLEIGREAESVELYEKIADYLKETPASRGPARAALGMAYMRLAERTNCVNQHGSDACIMPIQGNGVHTDKTPARKAVEMFELVLKENSNDLDSRWLLNIAYMTLGEYPANVPKQWLIPGLDNPGSVQVKPFTDLAGDLKLDVKNRAGGIIVEDFNNDGYLDIVSSAWGLDDPMHYYKSNGDGTFTDASHASGLSAFTGGLNLVQADYNNDGNMDIFVLRGAWQGVSGFGEQPNSLLRNNGDDTFTDVTFDAGLLSLCPTQAATWNDFNNDGWVDIFIGNETTDAQHPYPCELYINNQDGTFQKIPTNLSFFVKGATSGDFDNDGWTDIFLSCLSGEKVLLRNQCIKGRIAKFENVAQKAGLADNKSSTFPTFFFDYDNDGWLDLFFCNYNFTRPLSYYCAKEALHPSNDMTGKIYLYHNNKNGTFTNVTAQMHVNQTAFAMGANFGDIDNDGWLDMYLATGNPNYQSLVPNKMYKNLGGKDFADVTVSSRTGNLQKGHGVSFADLNNNGDQDICVDMGGAYRGDAYHSAFYLNPGQNDNHWICLKLVGTTSNRAAIGAKVAVKFRENGVERLVYREVNSGGSFGCSPMRREIGIGQATTIDEIEITWPASGIKQVLRNINPDQFIRVKEGQEGYEPVQLSALAFKKSDGSMPMCAPAR